MKTVKKMFNSHHGCMCERCMKFCRGNKVKGSIRKLTTKHIRNEKEKAIEMSLLENEIEAKSDYFDDECCGDNGFSGIDELQRQLMNDIIYDNDHFFDDDSLYDTTSDDAFGDYDWDY